MGATGGASSKSLHWIGIRSCFAFAREGTLPGNLIWLNSTETFSSLNPVVLPP
jgi:hypothetical protein